MEVDQTGANHNPPEYTSARPRTALLVDDSVPNLQWLSGILDLLGYDSTFALSIAQAKHALSDRPFDVVFLDCELPDGLGYLLAEQIPQMTLARRPAIIGMTASDDSELMLRYVSAGADGFMRKPIDATLVRECLRNCRLLNSEPPRSNPERQKMSFQNIHFMAGDDSGRFQFYLRQMSQQLETEVAALASACKIGEPDASRTIVHRLLSLTPLVESPEFTGLLQSCQRAARSHDLRLLQELGRAVETEYCFVKAAVQGELIPAATKTPADSSLRKIA